MGGKIFVPHTCLLVLRTNRVRQTGPSIEVLINNESSAAASGGFVNLLETARAVKVRCATQISLDLSDGMVHFLALVVLRVAGAFSFTDAL